jgi:hypothetical protein
MGPAPPSETAVTPQPEQAPVAEPKACPSDAQQQPAPDAKDVELALPNKSTVLGPSSTDDLFWGVKDLFNPKAIVGSFICQSFTHALGMAFMVKFALAPPPQKLMFQLCAAVLMGISNTCYVGTVVWYLRIMHGGWPMWLICAFDAMTFVVGFLEVMLLKQAKFGLLAMLGVCLPIMILLPGRRRWFVMKWSLVRIVFQLLGTVVVQNLPALQAKLPGWMAAFIFPLGAMLYKSICSPALFAMWNYAGRDNAPMFPVVLILGSIRYSSEALFFCGIVIGFAVKGDKSLLVAIFSVGYHMLFALLGRFGWMDQIQFLLGRLVWPDMKYPRSYLTEWQFRIAATQNCVMLYGYAYMACLALLLVAFNGSVVAPFLYSPVMWAVLGGAAVLGWIVEIVVALVQQHMRKAHNREHWSFVRLLTNMHAADAHVGIGTASETVQSMICAERAKETQIREESEEMTDFFCIGWRLMGLLLALDTSTAFLSAGVAAMVGRGISMYMAAQKGA